MPPIATLNRFGNIADYKKGNFDYGEKFSKSNELRNTKKTKSKPIELKVR
jgi:hypothetical protein